MLRLAAIALVLAGCSARDVAPRPGSVRAPADTTVAVLPFRTGGALSATADLVPDGEPRPTDEAGRLAARTLSTHLAALGVAARDPDAVAGAVELADTGRYGAGLARRVAERTRAGYAVLGTLVRFEQRDGTAWAARSPASVEYQVALVRASDGAVLLVDRFAYTQQALSENVLTLPQFLRGGGRWLTREEILDGALHETAGKIADALGVPRERTTRDR